MNRNKHVQNLKQQGFVSIFTVIFFALLITIVTIGFLRIMTIERRQSLDNDLSASALASAESGIEDGKRAILAYESLPSGHSLKSTLKNAMNSSNCDSLTSSAEIRDALGINATGNIVGNQQINQYYTCLNIRLNSPDYQNSLQAGSSDYIPLRSADPSGFDQVKVSWHLLSEGVDLNGDGTPARYPAGPLLSPVNNVTGNPTDSWSFQQYPTYLRVQLYGYPGGSNINRGDLEERSHTVVLAPGDPTSASAIDANSPINLGSVDPRGMDKTKVVLQQIKCGALTGIGSYACTATLELPSGASLRDPSNKYFLKVTPIYGQAHFKLAMTLAGAPVDFQEVQPTIDVTGRAADVFRRIQARVRSQPVLVKPPEFVVESADTICKNMEVSDGTYFVPNNCP